MCEGEVKKEKEYLALAQELEARTFSSFADFKNGEWYPEVDKKGKPTTENKGSELKGPFHLSRMLLVLISLEETGNILKYMQ